MGLIVETYPGTDGLVRAVDIRVNGKILHRPVHKMVRFLGEDHGTSPWGESIQSIQVFKVKQKLLVVVVELIQFFLSGLLLQIMGL